MLLLLFLLPVVFSQWGTTPAAVTQEQCQEEYDLINRCVTDQRLFSRLDDIPSRNKTKDFAVIKQGEEVLECSGHLFCNSSRIIQSYIYNQRWIVEKWHGAMASCFADGYIEQIGEQCHRTLPGRETSDKCDNQRLTPFLSCLQEKVKVKCTWSQVRVFAKVTKAFQASCMMLTQLEVEKEKANITTNY